MIVLDASAAVALLTDQGELGRFVANQLTANDGTAYPSLLPYEVANTLRRLCLREGLDAGTATDALRDLNSLGGEAFEFEELADRVWELRHNLSSYDAAYVALAELIDVPLLTLDRRLTAAPGTRCRFIGPPTE